RAQPATAQVAKDQESEFHKSILPPRRRDAERDRAGTRRGGLKSVAQFDDIGYAKLTVCAKELIGWTKNGSAMIETRDLCKNHGSLSGLRGVSLSVAEGEVAAIIGPSGGGKSTFLRCLNGLEEFHSGEVRVGQFTLTPGNHNRQAYERLLGVRRQLGMVFQQ